jgi:hypothetical protein
MNSERSLKCQKISNEKWMHTCRHHKVIAPKTDKICCLKTIFQSDSCRSDPGGGHPVPRAHSPRRQRIGLPQTPAPATARSSCCIAALPLSGACDMALIHFPGNSAAQLSPASRPGSPFTPRIDSATGSRPFGISCCALLPQATPSAGCGPGHTGTVLGDGPKVPNQHRFQFEYESQRNIYIAVTD